MSCEIEGESEMEITGIKKNEKIEEEPVVPLHNQRGERRHKENSSPRRGEENGGIVEYVEGEETGRW